MQTRARQQLAIHKGQALAVCWLLQQPVGAGGEILAGLTRTLAFSRPLSGTEWAALPPVARDRETQAFHRRVLRLFRQGLAIRCPVVAKVSPTARGLTVDRSRRLEGAGSGPAATAGGPRRPPAPMSALRGVVLAGAQARVLRALLPVGHRAQQGPPGEGKGRAGADAGVTRFTRTRRCRFNRRKARAPRRCVSLVADFPAGRGAAFDPTTERLSTAMAGRWTLWNQLDGVLADDTGQVRCQIRHPVPDLGEGRSRTALTLSMDQRPPERVG